MIADKWTDYEIIASGEGQKLERWGEIYLLRPDPQAIWPQKTKLSNFKGLNGQYIRSKEGGGEWQFKKPVPNEWEITYKNLKFMVKPMGFKHLGLFPEQAINWDIATRLIAGEKRQINVLNLFAYTGAASVAAAKAGARVTHVDSAKGMVERAGQNAKINAVDDKIRFIIDDCFKFVSREIKRGVTYDAIIMDPPSYGRGPKGETWRLEEGLFDLVKLCTNVLSKNPLFFLINSYTTGLQPTVLSNVLALNMAQFNGYQIGYEVTLRTGEGIPFPCGCSGLWTSHRLQTGE